MRGNENFSLICITSQSYLYSFTKLEKISFAKKYSLVKITTDQLLLPKSFNVFLQKLFFVLFELHLKNQIQCTITFEAINIVSHSPHFCFY